MPLPAQKNIWTVLKQFAVNIGGAGAPQMTIIPEGTVVEFRRRYTLAEINAGTAGLNAIPGFKYRLISATAIAIGGAMAALTTVDILATQGAASVKLVAFAQASLTQNTQLNSGDTGAAILAGGLSYVENDANTGITVNKTGASGTTATAVDVIILYTIVKV